MIDVNTLVKSGLADVLTAAQWVDSLNAAMTRYGIAASPARVAGFLSQCAHESGHFKTTVENLNYSAEGMASTWPTRFARKRPDGQYALNEKGRKTPNNLALSLHRQPERIANSVYANRLGNGDEASGDGWRHRGMGLIQLTGKATQLDYARAVGREAEIANDPSLISGPEHAALSAAWFWSTKGLNAIADTLDVVAMTKRVNGGEIGIDDRKRLYAAVSSVLPTA